MKEKTLRKHSLQWKLAASVRYIIKQVSVQLHHYHDNIWKKDFSQTSNMLHLCTRQGWLCQKTCDVTTSRYQQYSLTFTTSTKNKTSFSAEVSNRMHCISKQAVINRLRSRLRCLVRRFNVALSSSPVPLAQWTQQRMNRLAFHVITDRAQIGLTRTTYLLTFCTATNAAIARR